MPKLKVIDLFCGAGGFSEGFRQMGFEVTHAIDNWNPALVAHKENQPEAEVIKADIASLDPHQFPKPDVIIGGPPCTEFSGSKRGGGGDFALGRARRHRVPLDRQLAHRLHHPRSAGE